MLWRYAGSPASTDQELHFNDTNEAYDYAMNILRWAVGNGVINGYGDGRLSPEGLATKSAGGSDAAKLYRGAVVAKSIEMSPLGALSLSLFSWPSCDPYIPFCRISKFPYYMTANSLHTTFCQLCLQTIQITDSILNFGPSKQLDGILLYEANIMYFKFIEEI